MEIETEIKNTKDLVNYRKYKITQFVEELRKELENREDEEEQDINAK